MYQDPKTDWKNGDGLMTTDMERMENNLLHIKQHQEELASKNVLKEGVANETFNAIFARPGYRINSVETVNIMISHRDPLPTDGEDGDIWFKYREEE